MCNIFSPISDPTNPFHFLVNCFVDRDEEEKDAMTFQDRAPAQSPTITSRGLGEDSPFLTKFDDRSQLRSGLLHRKKRNYAVAAEGEEYGRIGYGYYHPYQPKPGRQIDPRMLPLLESFQELYFRRRDLFKRLFPKLHDEFARLSEELAAEVRSQNQGKPARALRRSLSVGSPRVVSRDIVVEPPLRLDRFKVRTVDLDEDTPPAPPPGGSKSK